MQWCNGAETTQADTGCASPLKQDASKIDTAADALLSRIDTNALAAAFGKKVDKDDKEAKEALQPFEEQKKFLIQALQGKVRLVVGKRKGARGGEAAGNIRPYHEG